MEEIIWLNANAHYIVNMLTLAGTYMTKLYICICIYVYSVCVCVCLYTINTEVLEEHFKVNYEFRISIIDFPQQKVLITNYSMTLTVDLEVHMADVYYLCVAQRYDWLLKLLHSVNV